MSRIGYEAFSPNLEKDPNLSFRRVYSLMQKGGESGVTRNFLRINVFSGTIEVYHTGKS